MGIDVQTLGKLRVSRDGAEISGLSGQRVRLALLVYLAVEGERTRDAALGLLWPDREQEKARHALNQTLYELRRALGNDWLAGEGDSLRVNDAVVADVRKFDRAIKDQSHARALELYRGAFLEGLYLAETAEFEAWVDGVRGRCARLFREASRCVVQECVTGRDLAGALAVAQRWAELEPLEDEAHHYVISILAETGRRADALRQFEAYEKMLAPDGLEPAVELKELVRRLRTGEIGGLPVSRPSPREPSELRRETLELGSSQPVGPRLVRILEGGRDAEAYLLRKETNVLGRTEGELVFTQDALMSAVHAEISVRPAGESGRRFFVRDAGSRNGVYIRLRDEWPLHDGDQFAVGRQVFRFERIREVTSP